MYASNSFKCRLETHQASRHHYRTVNTSGPMAIYLMRSSAGEESDDKINIVDVKVYLFCHTKHFSLFNLGLIVLSPVK
jgi:hypothetical protein